MLTKKEEDRTYIQLVPWYDVMLSGYGSGYHPTTVFIIIFSINTRYNKKIMKSCGLHILPDRRTFDRRFKTIPVGSMISTIGKRFATEKIIDASIVSVDSSMIRAKNGHVWHHKQMISGQVPRSGIDTDARWGFSGTKGWLFGYKLHWHAVLENCQFRYLPVLHQQTYTIIKSIRVW